MATLKILPPPEAPPFCELTLTRQEASFIKSVIGATEHSKTGERLYKLLDRYDIPGWSYLVSGSDCKELEDVIYLYPFYAKPDNNRGSHGKEQ